MKIIQVHNYYKEPGGEDRVAALERAMLEKHGHSVIPFYDDNDDIGADSGTACGKVFSLVGIAIKTIWNRQSYAKMRCMLQIEQPDIVHCHNIFPKISPAIYYACKREKVPVVQTLHNYRLLCLNAKLFREPKVVEGVSVTDKPAICEKCLSRKLKYPGVRYACYRNSVVASLVTMVMLGIHNAIGTWRNCVTTYIAVTEFARDKIIEGGVVPAEKIIVKTNFVPDAVAGNLCSVSTPLPVVRDGSPYFLFVGRLSPEKGVANLISSWAMLMHKNKSSKYRLVIVGDGSEKSLLEKMAKEKKSYDSIDFVGRLNSSQVFCIMRDSFMLVFPSIWYETFGMTVLEAGMAGTAALVSSPSAASALVKDGNNGILFEMGNANDLKDKMQRAIDNPKTVENMGKYAKDDFAAKYAEEKNYIEMMAIYEKAIQVTKMTT